MDVRQYDSSQKQTAIIGFEQNPATPSLHAILKKIEHEKGGFSIFRPFRITQLRDRGVPEGPATFLVGTRDSSGLRR